MSIYIISWWWSLARVYLLKWIKGDRPDEEDLFWKRLLAGFTHVVLPPEETWFEQMQACAREREETNAKELNLYFDEHSKTEEWKELMDLLNMDKIICQLDVLDGNLPCIDCYAELRAFGQKISLKLESRLRKALSSVNHIHEELRAGPKKT